MTTKIPVHLVFSEVPVMQTLADHFPLKPIPPVLYQDLGNWLVEEH